MWAQPTIAAGRVFVGADSGAVYSIDEVTGCVYWSFQADAGVRNAITIRADQGTRRREIWRLLWRHKGECYAWTQ